MPEVRRLHFFAIGVLVAFGCGGCRTGNHDSGKQFSSDRPPDPIIRVFSLYQLKPWLNLDAAGDRDPEGLEYRIFLDAGAGKGVLRDGQFRIDMYRIDRTTSGDIKRTLISDWIYPTSKFSAVKSPLLGYGYHIRLIWASKDTAGHEVEVITRYEAPDGRIVSAGTKRLRVPRYNS